MNDGKNENKIAHLTMIQNIISKMGGNLFYLRGWVITLVAGIIVLITQNNIGLFPFIFLILIIIIFWSYDAYFLSLERKYRDLYEIVSVKKDVDIDFSMKIPKSITEKSKNSIIFCFFSKTLIFFYIPILLAALYVIIFIK